MKDLFYDESDHFIYRLIARDDADPLFEIKNIQNSENISASTFWLNDLGIAIDTYMHTFVDEVRCDLFGIRRGFKSSLVVTVEDDGRWHRTMDIPYAYVEEFMEIRKTLYEEYLKYPEYLI